jgi:hypothetical protein
MARLKKKAHEMTGEEVMKRIFHPKAHPHIKKAVKEITAKKVKK